MMSTARTSARQPWLLAGLAVVLMVVILRATHRVYGDDAGALTAWSAVTVAACVWSAGSLLVVHRARDMQKLPRLHRWFLGAALAVSPFIVSNAAVTLGEPVWTLWAAFAWAVLVLLGWTAWHVTRHD